MSKSLLTLSRTLLFLFLSFSAQAQWEQTNGPYGGGLSVFCTMGQRIIASNGYDVYYTDDNAISWKKSLKAAINGINAYCLVTDGKTVYLGCHTGCFMSLDKGQTWTKVSSNTTRSVAFAQNGVYLSGENLMFSGNNGSDFILVKNNGSVIRADEVVVIGKTIFVGAGTYIYLSNDNGVNWTVSNLPNISAPGFDFINKMHVKDSVVFVSTRNSGLLVTRNMGKSWESCNTGFNSWLVDEIYFYNTANRIYVSPGDYVYYSENYGLSWTLLPSGSMFTSVGGNQNVLLGSVSGSGVFSYVENTKTWKESNTGILSSNISALVNSGNNIVAGGSGGFYSSDKGNSWLRSKGISTDIYVRQFLDLKDYLVVGSNKGILISYDNGKTFGYTALRNDINSFCKTTNRILTYSYSNGFSYSIDDAVTWKSIIYANSDVLFSKMMAQNKEVYAVSIFGQNPLYRSKDEGETWEPFGEGLPYLTINDICVTSTNVFLATSLGLYKLSVDKMSWKFVISAISNCSKLNYINNTLYAVTKEKAVYESSNEGKTWEQFLEAAPDFITDVTISNEYMLIGTVRSSVLRYKQDLITSVKGISESKSDFQVYPNPSQGRFSLLAPYGDLTIEIIDLTGQVIIKLQTLKGLNKLSFPNMKGVYLLKASNETENYVQRIVID